MLLGAALVGAQEVSARETVLIAGNADLYPIESYDSRSNSYVGLLPELYRRYQAALKRAGQMDYDDQMVFALQILRAEDLRSIPHGEKLAALLHLK